MTLHGKTRRGQPLQAGQTAMDFEDPSTASALEMVVMRLTGNFIPGRFAWEFYGGEPTFIDQGFHISVNSGDAQTFHLGLGQIEDFASG